MKSGASASDRRPWAMVEGFDPDQSSDSHCGHLSLDAGSATPNGPGMSSPGAAVGAFATEAIPDLTLGLPVRALLIVLRRCEAQRNESRS